MPVAATPAWFADNITMVAVAVLIVLTVLVLRLVKDAITRTILLVLIVAVAVLVYVNRDPLKTCARECECQIAERDIDVPMCDPDLELSSGVTRARLLA